MPCHICCCGCFRYQTVLLPLPYKICIKIFKQRRILSGLCLQIVHAVTLSGKLQTVAWSHSFLSKQFSFAGIRFMYKRRGCFRYRTHLYTAPQKRNLSLSNFLHIYMTVIGTKIAQRFNFIWLLFRKTTQYL